MLQEFQLPRGHLPRSGLTHNSFMLHFTVFAELLFFLFMIFFCRRKLTIFYGNLFTRHGEGGAIF